MQQFSPTGSLDIAIEQDPHPGGFATRMMRAPTWGGGGNGVGAGRGGGGGRVGGAWAWEGVGPEGAPVGAGPRMGLGMASGSFRFRSAPLWSAICLTCTSGPAASPRCAGSQHGIQPCWVTFQSPCQA